jgi:hypothetical protein
MNMPFTPLYQQIQTQHLLSLVLKGTDPQYASELEVFQLVPPMSSDSSLISII